MDQLTVSEAEQIAQYKRDHGLISVSSTSKDSPEAVTEARRAEIIESFLQARKNQLMRDDTRGKFCFLASNRQDTNDAIAIADIDYATLARLTVLAGHISYHTPEKGKKGVECTRKSNTIMRSASGGRVNATKDDIRRILDLPPVTWTNFWQTALEHKYITGNDQDGYQLTDIYRYGQLERGTSTHVQKVYIAPMLQLYNSGKVVTAQGVRNGKISDHKMIGKVIKLAVYHMHPATNQLVSNPQEPDVCNLHPMGASEIAQALGHKVTAGHAARDVARLCSLAFPGEDGRDMYCVISRNADNGPVYYVNPMLIYAGSKHDYPKMLEQEDWYVATGQGSPQNGGQSPKNHRRV